MKALPTVCAAVLLALPTASVAETYYVSPTGDDAHTGKAADRPWRTVVRVNAARFQPGDQVLFARDGVWRESLQASSSGTAEHPIVFSTYGQGAKPRFLGSDVLKNDAFQPGPNGTYTQPATNCIASVLVNQQFLLQASDPNAVKSKPGTWCWAGQTLHVNTGSNPRSDGRAYTACVRVDCIHSNGKDHLIFRDLVGDESADPRDGYAFRVMGSNNVRLENCEAYRAGRHHFGVINSTNFVGQGLHCAHAMPNIPGGATFYVSYSDIRRKGDTHRWLDCSGAHFENPGQRNYQVFYDHGEGLGPILIQNLRSAGGTFSVGSSRTAPVTIKGGRVDDAPLEIFGSHAHVDGLVITGNGGIDHWASDSLYENVRLLGIVPKNGGSTGYSAAVVIRPDARNNVLRFCTITLDPKAGNGASGVSFIGRGSATRWVGNLVQGPGTALKSWAGGLDRTDLVQCDFNLYRALPTFSERDGQALDLAAWRKRGFDGNTRTGDALLAADGALCAGSLAIGAARIAATARPAADAIGTPRTGDACAIGAFEPITSRQATRK